jgi:prevent-host-death family protein
METVSKSKFKPAALRYFRRVEEKGEEIVITDRGRPVAKIIPYRVEGSTADRALQRLRGTLLHYDAPDEPVGLEDWDALR